MPDQITDQLPVALDPARLATLFPQVSAASPTAPAAPQAAPSDLAGTIQQQAQMGMGAFGERERTAMDIGRQLYGSPGAATQDVLGRQLASTPRTPGLIEQQQAQASKLAFHPNFHGGFLHNLGQALLTMGAATAPGQAIQDVIYSEPRQEYAGRAEQIKSLMEEQKQVQEPMTAAAGMAYKPFQAQAQVERSEAMKARVAAYTQKIQNDLAVQMRGLDIKQLLAGSQQELNKARALLDRVMAQQAPERTAIMKEGVELGNYTKQAVEQALIELGAQKEHNISSLADWIMGTTITPPAPRVGAPGGPGTTVPPSPQKPAAKPQAKAGAPVPKDTIVYDPQGQAHRSDGTHPLPKGWSTTKPGA